MSLLLLLRGGAGAVTPTSTSRITVRQQPTHACEIQLRSGEYLRFGPDEADVGNVPVALDCDTELPGGYGPANTTLPKPDWMQADDAKLFASTRFYFAETDQTFHEGRITGTPQVGASQIQLQIEGWAKHAEDNQTARFLGIDRDLSRWQGMSVQRQINVRSAGFVIADGTVAPDPATGSPSVVTALTGAWGLKSVTEAWYDSQGLAIDILDFAWKIDATTINATDANWSWVVYLSPDDLGTVADSSGSLRAAGPGSGSLSAAGIRSWALVQVQYAVAAGVDGMSYPTYWTLLAPIGDHGLPLHGTVAAPNSGRWLLASDVVPYLISRFAPLWSYTTGAGGSIPPTAFAITHSAYLEPTTLSAMLGDMTLLGGTSDYPLDWGVYDNREFFMKALGSYGTVWHARRDQATEPTSQGADAADRLNGVLVSYDDGTGTKFTVGPPGSGADLEDTRLQDISPGNPANEDGASHWQSFDAGITTQSGAITIGQIMLAAANRREWRGDIALKDTVCDSAGIEYPVALVKAGDRVVIEDDADTSERRIVNTAYDASDRTLTASVGAPPNALDVLLAQTRLVTTTAIGGG